MNIGSSAKRRNPQAVVRPQSLNATQFCRSQSELRDNFLSATLENLTLPNGQQSVFWITSQLSFHFSDCFHRSLPRCDIHTTRHAVVSSTRRHSGRCRTTFVKEKSFSSYWRADLRFHRYCSWHCETTDTTAGLRSLPWCVCFLRWFLNNNNNNNNNRNMTVSCLCLYISGC